VTVCQSMVGRRLGDARVTSGEVKGPPGGALVGKFSLRTPKFEVTMASWKSLPLASSLDEYQRL